MRKYRKDYTPSDFQIPETSLVFQIFEWETIVQSRLKIMRINPTSEVLSLHGQDLSLQSLKIDGNTISNHTIHEQGIDIPWTYGDGAIIEITVSICPEKNTHLEGLYFASRFYCTQNEPEGFRHITYTLDRPDVMSRFHVRIEADTTYPILLSNGNKIAEGELENNRHFTEWDDPFLKPTYLFALVAADLEQIHETFTTMSGRVVDLYIFVDHGKAPEALHAMESLKRSMRWDEVTFGREYDLDVFHIVATESFNMGAMENKSLNIFNSMYVLASLEKSLDVDFLNVEAVIGHEYFHNWTGNRITCRDWFQLTLKEGLTVFRDQSFSGDMHSNETQRIGDIQTLREIQFTEDAGSMTHPIQPDSYIEMNNFYTATVYEKGSEVIRMIATMLGKEKFRKAMDLYFETFDGQAVTTQDFVWAMSTGGGRDLTQFEETWYHQSHTPMIQVTQSYNIWTRELHISIKQLEQSDNDGTILKPWYFPLGIGIFDSVKKTPQTLIIQNGTSQDLISRDMLIISKKEETFIFENIEPNSILSINRGFTAPIKVISDSTEHIFLMQYETNRITRYESAQSALKENIINILHGETINTAYIDAYIALLEESIDDELFHSLLISIPSTESIIPEIADCDPLTLDEARERFLSLLGADTERLEKIKDTLESELNNILQNSEGITDREIAKRAKVTRLLHILTLLGIDTRSLCELCLKSKTMTLQIAWWKSLFLQDQVDTVIRMESWLIETGYMSDLLMKMKFFSLISQNIDKTHLSIITQYLDGPYFDYKIPNLIRTLIGGIARNTKVFHSEDGSGYDWYLKEIEKINAINPQITARIARAFTQTNLLHDSYKKRILPKIEEVLNSKKLSSEVTEILSSIK
jgi:aminopeptidase N